MKITCETNVINRLYPQAKNRTQKSTVAVGTHPPNKENTEFFILIFNAQNKTGTRYKIKDNIQKIFTKFLHDGRITISFKEPEQDLQIKCDAVQLKAYLNVLKLALQGKKTNESGQQVISHVTTFTKHDTVKTKLVIHSRKDYPIKGLPRTLTFLEMSEMKFCRVDSQVYLLKNLTHLDLHTNLIDKIPTQLGNLRLREINFANNRLAGTSWKWLLGKELSQSLCTLNLSDNQLTYFPVATTKLKNLTKLIIQKNQIKKLPISIRNMRSLRYLDLSSNLLESVPQNINFLRLEYLNLSDNLFPCCHLATGIEEGLQFSMMPSLFELAARRVIYHCIPYSPATVPRIIVDIMEASPLCQCGTLCCNPKIYEKAKILDNLRFETVVKDPGRLLPADYVFCSRRCLWKNTIRLN